MRNDTAFSHYYQILIFIKTVILGMWYTLSYGGWFSSIEILIFFLFLSRTTLLVNNIICHLLVAFFFLYRSLYLVLLYFCVVVNYFTDDIKIINKFYKCCGLNHAWAGQGVKCHLDWLWNPPGDWWTPRQGVFHRPCTCGPVRESMSGSLPLFSGTALFPYSIFSQTWNENLSSTITICHNISPWSWPVPVLKI